MQQVMSRHRSNLPLLVSIGDRDRHGVQVGPQRWRRLRRNVAADRPGLRCAVADLAHRVGANRIAPVRRVP